MGQCRDREGVDPERDQLGDVRILRAAERALDVIFFFSSRRRHTRFDCDWSSDVCSSDLASLRVGDSPLRYSMVMNTVRPSRSQSMTRTMFGCGSVCSLWASLCNTASDS